MLINEVILDEDVAETKDLMAIADYISQWMLSDISKEYDGDELEIVDIYKISKMPIPNVTTKTVKWLILRPMPDRTRSPLKFVTHLPENTFDNERGAYFPPPYHSININLDLILKRKGDPASIILHELQHALDNLKSGGKAMDNYSTPSSDLAAYMKHPSEINARFAQALWDMAVKYETVARGDVYAAITQNLDKHKLRATDFSDQKAYKRLITRAYKFLDDISQIIADKQKPTFAQKVKNLIKKWLPL